MKGNLNSPELLILCPVPVDISETGLGFNAGGLNIISSNLQGRALGVGSS